MNKLKPESHPLNELKPSEIAFNCDKISDVQNSLSRTGLSVSQCGSFPRGAFPLLWRKEVYRDDHQECSFLCLCSGCFFLSLMVLYIRSQLTVRTAGVS